MVLYRLLSKIRMAFVEDDPILRDALSFFFETKGCHAEFFESAEDASEAAEGGRVDAVISDRVLPGEDGLSFLRRVRKNCPGAFTVLMTAYPSPGLYGEILQCGIDSLLLKPFTVEGLEQLLTKLLAKGSAGNGARPPEEPGV